MSDLTMSDTQTIQTQAAHPTFFLMNNVIQNYAWGSTTSVNQLFGIENPTGEPQAEVWMGAHPNGCSMVTVNGEETKLSSLIAQDMNAFLSEEVANRFGELPYLFKVLAAEKALSIQVHPNKQQAELGFALEEKQGIPLTAANRNYKDPNHKPELVYALTEYQAMNASAQQVKSSASFLSWRFLSCKAWWMTLSTIKLQKAWRASSPVYCHWKANRKRWR